MASVSYTDPATGETFDCSNPDYHGWLTKQVIYLN